MSTTTQTFRTVLEATGGNNVGIVVPDDIVVSFNRGKRVSVSVTIDGDYIYRNTITSMGDRSLLSFNAATRKATGRRAGDEVEVRLELDDAPRTVEIPAVLMDVFASDTKASTAWDALPPSKKNAHALSIEGAKSDETRRRRLEKTIEALRG